MLFPWKQNFHVLPQMATLSLKLRRLYNEDKVHCFKRERRSEGEGVKVIKEMMKWDEGF
jgi:hypothetical protein